VLRVKPTVCEGMFRHRIGDAELMPAPAHGEDRVEAAELCIQRHAVILPCNRRCGYTKAGAAVALERQMVSALRGWRSSSTHEIRGFAAVRELARVRRSAASG